MKKLVIIIGIILVHLAALVVGRATASFEEKEYRSQAQYDTFEDGSYAEHDTWLLPPVRTAVENLSGKNRVSASTGFHENDLANIHDDSFTAYAYARDLTDSEDSWARASSYVCVDFNFIATRPEIMVEFDWVEYAQGEATDMKPQVAYAYSRSGISVTLWDVMANIYTPIFHATPIEQTGVEGGYAAYGEYYENLLIPTLEGRQYEIQLLVEAYSAGVDNAWARTRAELIDLKISSIPIPPSIVMFFSGILGLLVYKRRLA